MGIGDEDCKDRSPMGIDDEGFHTMKQKHTYVTKGENSLTNAQVIEKVKRRRA